MPSTAEEWLYWIVQPLTEGSPRDDGFRRFFHNPFMGAAEYDEPGMDLKKLYEESGGAPVIEVYEITVPPTSRPVYFVGRGTDLASRAHLMELWLRSGGEKKLPCWFAECFHGPTAEITVPSFSSPVVAWWAMGRGFMFTLDPTVAENLLKAIHLEATTHASFGTAGGTDYRRLSLRGVRDGSLSQKSRTGAPGDGRISLPSMRMLHLGLRVSDLEQSLAFYTALGYAKLGGVPETEFGSLTMLQLPDDPFVSLELVHDPERPVEDVSAVNHLVVQVDDLDATIADLAARGVTADPPAEPGPKVRTSWLTDPDGYRIELVQWPPGHPAGMTAADFAPDRGE